MPAKVSVFPKKRRPLQGGAFQSVAEDILFGIEGDVDAYAVIVWYRDGARLKNISPGAMEKLKQFMEDEAIGAEYGDGA